MPEKRQNQGHRRVELQQGGAGAPAEGVQRGKQPSNRVYILPTNSPVQVPAVHQIELHPWLQQKDFTAFHKAKGIHIVAYSPFGNQNDVYDSGKNMGKLMDDPVLQEIGKKHSKTGAQVALAWGITAGHSVIPKSKTEERIKQNLGGDFKLDEDDMKKIADIDKKLRFNDPSKSFGWNFYADLDGKKA